MHMYSQSQFYRRFDKFWAAAEVWNWMTLQQGKDEDEEEDEGAFWLVEGGANE